MSYEKTGGSNQRTEWIRFYTRGGTSSFGPTQTRRIAVACGWRTQNYGWRNKVSEIYVTILEDRHIDTVVQGYRDELVAIQAAWNQAKRGARNYPDDLDDSMTPAMRDAGWISYICYSPEGDSVRVERLKMMEEQGE